MRDDRTQLAVALLITMDLVAVLVGYPVSFGPAWRLYSRCQATAWEKDAFLWFYST